MRVIVVYIFPLNGSGQYLDLAIRFLTSYHEYPAGLEHELLVVCNGVPVTDETRCLFDSVPNCRYMTHDNSGFDCGAYQAAARANPDAELMVFFGASSYIRGPNWLWRMAEAYNRRGPGLFGTMANRGNGGFGVWPHIRTTCFWMPPKLFNEYPVSITRPEQRYGFEHGPDCLTSWVKKKGLKAWCCSWTNEYLWEQWDSFPGGYHRGNQENLIAGDRMSAPPYHYCA